MALNTPSLVQRLEIQMDKIVRIISNSNSKRFCVGPLILPPLPPLHYNPLLHFHTPIYFSRYVRDFPIYIHTHFTTGLLVVRYKREQFGSIGDWVFVHFVIWRPVIVMRSMSIPKEPEQVMKQRDGSVLGKKTILKSDHFPGCQNRRLSPHIDGAPNYRKVCFYLWIFVCCLYQKLFTVWTKCCLPFDLSCLNFSICLIFQLLWSWFVFFITCWLYNAQVKLCIQINCF